jgi:uncharacterized coiled-coil DUF342 family protein
MTLNFEAECERLTNELWKMSEASDAMLKHVDDMQRKIDHYSANLRNADAEITALTDEVRVLRLLLEAYNVNPEDEAAFRAAEKKYAVPPQ